MVDIAHLKILIVDDHFTARQIVSDVMREQNIARVHMASDGVEAREAIYQAHEHGTPFDIVFLDWNMPQVEGIEVLRHFRTQPQFNRTAFGDADGGGPNRVKCCRR